MLKNPPRQTMNTNSMVGAKKPPTGVVDMFNSYLLLKPVLS